MFKKKKHKKISQKHSYFQQALTHLFQEDLTQVYTERQLQKKLKVLDRASKQELKKVLLALLKQGKLHQLTRGRFSWQHAVTQYIGKVDHVSPDFAYIVVEGREEDIWVSAKNLRGAMDQDTVKVVIMHYGSGRRMEGKVLEVLERGKTQWVGKLLQKNKKSVLKPTSNRFHHAIELVDDFDPQYIGQKALVKITYWPQHPRAFAQGEIVRILGQSGSHGVEMDAIMLEYGLSPDFPEAVTDEMKTIAKKLPEKEYKRRRDFRSIPTFTIDPEDAKDFDDAFSVQKLPNGNIEVGVHIADVSFYVKENTAIDEEAFSRGTSVYLVDRTIPMLPEILSNDLCSLKPHEDRCTMAAVFELDQEGVIQGEWFGETIIHSDQRFVYEEAQQIIDQQAGEWVEELTLLNQLAKKIRHRREAEGAINFETTEVKIILDEQGEPIQVVPKIRKDTHKLVEEFMLLANRRVAEKVYHLHPEKGKLTFVYRTHDEPDMEKITTLSLFVKKMGYTLSTKKGSLSNSFNALIQDIEGKPESNIIQSLSIRTMAKAVYTTQANPHFAMAFRHYTHFTSPIRRYPDLLVHRLLKKYLKEKSISSSRREYEEKCKHASAMEKRAVEAERSSIKYKQVMMMEKLKGKTLQGIVSGITKWGMYIEILSNKCEGMVPLAKMEDDYYILDEKNFRIIGRNHKRIYKLGDLVMVRVDHCDIERRTVDLSVTDEELPGS